MLSRGLIIGKFMPPHLGHQFVIDAALRQVEHLTVVVCSRPQEPIPGDLRHQWVQELYPLPTVTVLHLHLDLPDPPPNDPHHHWDRWREALRQALPHSVSHVFGSEEYLPQLASEQNAVPVWVDPPRHAVPISATAIRHDPFHHFCFIARPARPYFTRRVVVMGPESTGKTTLCKRLARHFQASWTPEYARLYLEGLGRQCETLADIEAIGRGQQGLMAQTVACAPAGLVVHDTDLLTTAYWSRHYTGTCPTWLEAAAADDRADLYLLLSPDVPWVPDLLRDGPDTRAKVFEDLRTILADRHRPLAVIGGDWEQRTQQAIAVIESLVRAAPAN